MSLKNFLFNLHYYSALICTYGWVLHPYIVYIQSIVLISWILNNNKCILSQFEYYFFYETFRGVGQRFKVSDYMRYTLYINNLLAILYKLKFNKYLFNILPNTRIIKIE